MKVLNNHATQLEQGKYSNNKTIANLKANIEKYKANIEKYKANIGKVHAQEVIDLINKVATKITNVENKIPKNSHPSNLAHSGGTK